MFINVTLSNNMTRTPLMVSADTSIKQILEDNGVDYSRAGVSLDSAPIGGNELNKTLAEHGYDGSTGHDRAFLSVVVKADNA